MAITNSNKYANQVDKNETYTLYKYSDDNGLSWSGETKLNLLNNYILFGPSPASGVQLTNGTLVIPAFVSMLDKSYRSGIIFKTPADNWEYSCINTKQSYSV